MKKIFLLLMGIILLFFFQSCKKNKAYNLAPNVNVANDVILSSSSFTTIFNLLIKARLNPSLTLNGYATIDGANVTYDSAVPEYVFGFGSALSPDSVQRNGSIIVLMSGDILQKGSYAKVSFQSYSEDNGKVDGDDSITNEGVNALNQIVFSDYVSNGTMVKRISVGTINVNINSTYKALNSTLVPGGDILFLIKGTFSGLSSKGHPFSAYILDTLQDSFSCPWIEGGIINVHVSDSQVPDGYIDFVSSDGCSDVIWYYFDDSSFKVRKNQYYLMN
jgi:hypothetical protein